MVLNSNQLYKFGWNHSFYDIPKETSKEIQSNVQSNRDGLTYRKFIFIYRYINFYIIYRFCEGKNNYFFVKINKNKIDEYKITNNAELFILIIKNNAFNENYRRHFKINKLLKK
jgi:maltose-binding protein MalE